MLSFLREFWMFLRVRKKYWLLPIFLMMALFGALIVRPYGYDPMAGRAYNHADSSYDHEYLFLLSEMDPRIHGALELYGFTAGTLQVEAAGWLADYFSGYWFVNGRNAPDTMLMSGVPWLPSQPYGTMVRMTPGDRILMVSYGSGAGSDAFIYTVTDLIRTVQDKAGKTRDMLDRNKVYIDYGTYAKYRGKIRKAE